MDRNLQNKRDNDSLLLDKLILWPGVMVLAVIAFALLGYGCFGKKAPEMEPVEVELDNVGVISLKEQVFHSKLELPARLKAAESISVKSEVAARIVKWLIPEGGKVQQGQQVVQLDDEELQLQLKLAGAALKSSIYSRQMSNEGLRVAEATVKQAEKKRKLLDSELEAALSDKKLADSEYARIKGLAAQNIASTSQLENAENRKTQANVQVTRTQDGIAQADLSVVQAKAQLASAKSSYDLAESQVVQAQLNIKVLESKIAKTKIISPISGVLEKHIIKEGELASVDTQLAVIYDFSKIRAVVHIADRFMPFLADNEELINTYTEIAMPGAKRDLQCSVTIPGLPKLMGGKYQGVSFKAKLARVDQATDPGSNTFAAELEFANPGDVFKEGILANATIKYLKYDHALVIPVKAVNVTEQGPQVLVVKKDGDAWITEVRYIDLVTIDAESLLVGSGLHDGEYIISEGIKGVLDQERVNVVRIDGELTDKYNKGNE